MLIKEYRIPLPMSVEEYRIAQLYMIQMPWPSGQIDMYALISKAGDTADSSGDLGRCRVS